MGYGLTLMVMLLVINIFMYWYGIDINITGVLNAGVTPLGTSTNTMQPSGAQSGGLTTTSGVYDIIVVIMLVLAGGTAVGIIISAIAPNYSVFFTIPAGMIIIFLVMYMTPMGNIFTAQTNTIGQVCYHMREPATYETSYTGVMFNRDVSNADTCIPSEAHLLLTVFLGLMLIATFMTFIGGREW